MIDRDRTAGRRGRPAPCACCGAPPSLRQVMRRRRASPAGGLWPLGQILDADGQLHLLADKAEARRMRRRRAGGRASPGWPESSTCSGAPTACGKVLASPAGRRATSPSVIMTTPARRWRGTSDSARSARRTAGCRHRRRRAAAAAGADDAQIEVGLVRRAARLTAASAASVACAAVADAPGSANGRRRRSRRRAAARAAPRPATG